MERWHNGFMGVVQMSLQLKQWWNSLDKTTQYTFIVLFLGTLLRLLITFFVAPSGDSTWHLAVARFIAEEQYIPLFEPLGRLAFWAPPLFHIIAALFYNLFLPFGEAIATKAMDFVMPIFGSASLFVLYGIAKQYLSKKETLFAVGFLSFLPIHVYYSTISHIDAFLTFFVLLTIYFTLKHRFYLAALSSGLGMLAKYNFLFIIPFVLYALCKAKKATAEKAKTIIFYIFITIGVGLPWYIRNTIHLGNPIYHFFNPVFKMFGLSPFQFETLERIPSLAHFDFTTVQKVFLDFFGVPLGLVDNLQHIHLPFMPLPLYLWFVLIGGCSILLLYSFLSTKRKDIWNIALWWFLPFALMLFLYVYEFGDVFLRLFLPALPVFALFFGITAARLARKRVCLFLFILIAAVFAAQECYKVNVAADQHEQYFPDYQWVRENTPENATISPGVIELIYYTDRLAGNCNQTNLILWKDKRYTPCNDTFLYNSTTTEVQIGLQ